MSVRKVAMTENATGILNAATDDDYIQIALGGNRLCAVLLKLSSKKHCSDLHSIFELTRNFLNLSKKGNAMWMRLSPILLVLLMAPAKAQELQVIGIEVEGKGVYRLETGSAEAVENTATGEVASVKRSRLVTETDTIAGEMGTEFGFQYTILGSPEEADVSLDFVISYPEQGLTNPDNGETIKQSRYSLKKKIGTSEYMGYGFESDWEIEEGDWLFEIWYDGTMLTKQRFAVVQ